MTDNIDIEIYGQNYTIKGGGDGQYITKLAKYVDGKMHEISKSTKNLPTTKLALLAAINITHELFQTQQDRKAKEKMIEKRTKDLVENIEQQFGDLKLY